MDPLISHICERARNNDPRLRHISLRSLPLLEVTNEEMYAVVESLQYNTHVNTFDMSIYNNEHAVVDFDGPVVPEVVDEEDDDTIIIMEEDNENMIIEIDIDIDGDEDQDVVDDDAALGNENPNHHDDIHDNVNHAFITATPPQPPQPPPFELIFSRNSSLVDIRISSSSCSILACVFKGLALNESVQILQVGEMSAIPGDTTNMTVPCSLELERMLQWNKSIHRLALQGFHWQDPTALRHVANGLRENETIRVLELVQIVTTYNHNHTATTTATAESDLHRHDLMGAIGEMKHLKRLSVIACEISDMSFASSSSSTHHTVPTDLLLICESDTGTDIAHAAASSSVMTSQDNVHPLNMDVDIPMNTRLNSNNNNNNNKDSHKSTSTLDDDHNCKPQLEELRLVECELSGPSIYSLQRTWNYNPFLRILDVRGNNLDDDSCVALALILNTATVLTKVILEENNIGDQGLAALCRNGLDRNKTLEQISIKDNNFGPRGVEALADALERNTSLQQVDLSYNFVGDDGAAALGRMLQCNSSLQDLVLENGTIQGAGVTRLCTGLACNKTLQKLNLSGNTFGSAGVEALADLLQNKNSTSSLSSLRLSSCHLGDAGVKVLAQALEHNTYLEEIVLPFNRFGDEGAKAIGESLPKWIGLTSLQIQFNLFSENGFEMIVEGLSKNFYLKSMYLLNAGPSNRHIDTMFQKMQYFVRLNKGGRRVLNEKKSLRPALWPTVLARANKAYAPDAIFFLLRERPDIVSLPYNCDHDEDK